jgi:hypothetical protein
MVGPIAGLIELAGLVLTAFALGSGRGFGLHPSLLKVLGFYAFFALGGAFLGGLIGAIGARIGPPRPGSRWASWWEWATRRRTVSRHSSRVTRRRLWPWLIGVPVVLVLVAAFVVGRAAGGAVDQRLARATAEADRDDPFWRLNDLLAHRRPVPDEENSAHVVDEALAYLPKGWPAGDRPAEVQAAYKAASDTTDNVRLDDAVAVSLRQELETYSEAVRIARRVAEYRRGRHELAIGPAIIDTPLADTQAARIPARLLAADAMMRAHDGDIDGALDSCRALLSVGRSIGDEPFIISHLVRIAIGGVAMQTVRRVLGQSEASDEALGRLEVLLLDEVQEPILLYALCGERAGLDEMIRRVRSGELPISALSEAGPPLDPNRPRDMIAPWGRLMFDSHRATGLEWMNQAIAIARRPIAEQPRLWKTWETEIDRVRLSRFGFMTATLPILMVPSMTSFHGAYMRYQSELGTSAILLAAERHRRRTGAWPVAVEEIGHELLPHAPVDPFSGSPFRMAHRDGQFFVYSIGPDRRDGQGVYDVRRWMNGGPDDVGNHAWDPSLRGQPSRNDARE